MTTLVYINSENGLAKSAHEVVSYAKKLGEEVLWLQMEHKTNLHYPN
jgi:hypothetical protein